MPKKLSAYYAAKLNKNNKTLIFRHGQSVMSANLSKATGKSTPEIKCEE